jgi:hypothetical protein
MATLSRAERLVFEDLNFVFETPGTPWQRVDIGRPPQVLTLINPGPQIGFIVVAEATDLRTIGSRAIVEIKVKSMQKTMDDVRTLEAEDYAVHDLAGRRIVLDCYAKGRQVVYVVWGFASHGYLF